MDLNDVLTLAKAGFTAPQITALLSTSLSTQNPNSNPNTNTFSYSNQNPNSAPNTFPTAPAPTPAPAIVPAPAPDPYNGMSEGTAPVPTQALAKDPFQDIMQQLGLMQNTIQNNALLAAQQPKEQTVDDILAEIINPPEPKK